MLNPIVGSIGKKTFFLVEIVVPKLQRDDEIPPTYEKMQESEIELGAIFGYAQNKTRNELVWKPCTENYAVIQKPPNQKIQLVPVYSA